MPEVTATSVPGSPPMEPMDPVALARWVLIIADRDYGLTREQVRVLAAEVHRLHAEVHQGVTQAYSLACGDPHSPLLEEMVGAAIKTAVAQERERCAALAKSIVEAIRLP